MVLVLVLMDAVEIFALQPTSTDQGVAQVEEPADRPAERL